MFMFNIISLNKVPFFVRYSVMSVRAILECLPCMYVSRILDCDYFQRNKVDPMLVVVFIYLKCQAMCTI